MNLPQFSRSAMPSGNMTDFNPEMAQQISENAVFGAITKEVEHQRIVQAQKYNYTYVLNDEIAGQQTLPFFVTIEQGTDFWCKHLTISCYSYEDTSGAGDATSFPIPNSAGLADWAGRGLSVRIVDTRSGRELTSGFVPLELLGTPGYGLNIQKPYPFNYFFYRNTKVRFDIRNRDVAARTHEFAIALNGFKVTTPQ